MSPVPCALPIVAAEPIFDHLASLSLRYNLLKLILIIQKIIVIPFKTEGAGLVPSPESRRASSNILSAAASCSSRFSIVYSSSSFSSLSLSLAFAK